MINVQKKLDKFLKKEIEKLKDIQFIEGITFEQLKKISKGEEEDYFN